MQFIVKARRRGQWATCYLESIPERSALHGTMGDYGWGTDPARALRFDKRKTAVHHAARWYGCEERATVEQVKQAEPRRYRVRVAARILTVAEFSIRASSLAEAVRHAESVDLDERTLRFDLEDIEEKTTTLDLESVDDYEEGGQDCHNFTS